MMMMMNELASIQAKEISLFIKFDAFPRIHFFAGVLKISFAHSTQKISFSFSASSLFSIRDGDCWVWKTMMIVYFCLF
jgi:hypothetical protein